MAASEELRGIQSSIDSTRAALDEILEELHVLKNANRVHRIKFWVLGLLCVGMFMLTWYVWDASNKSRNDLAEHFEATQVLNCEISQDSRVRLRGVFELFLTLAAEQAEDPEAADRFIERFNEQIEEAVPDRDCAAEAEDREHLT